MQWKHNKNCIDDLFMFLPILAISLKQYLKTWVFMKDSKEKKMDLINVRPIGTCKGLEPLSQCVASFISLVWVMETFLHCHLEKNKIMIVTNPLKVIVQLNLHVSTMASNPTKKKIQL